MKRKDGDDRREGGGHSEMRGREEAEEGDGKGANMGRKGRRRRRGDENR